MKTVLIVVVLWVALMSTYGSTPVLAADNAPSSDSPGPSEPAAASQASGAFGASGAAARKVTQEELDAIQQLHSSLDKDKDGSINILESGKFLKNENDAEIKSTWVQKQKAFHKLDTDHDDNDFISVNELQAAWIYSPIRKWTVNDVIAWLNDKVRLPQYASAFRRNGIDGKKLPYLAMNNGKVLRESIGVTDPLHLNQFINRITLDVVFGGDEPQNALKDALLAVFGVALPLLLVLFCRTSHESKARDRLLQQMNENLVKAQKAAEEYQSQLNESSSKHSKYLQEMQEQKKLMEHQLQREISEAKQEASKFQHSRQNADLLQQRLAFAEKELEQLRSALIRAEEQLSASTNWRQTDDLRVLLQRTYAVELQNHSVKRQEAEAQLKQAQDALDHVAKKRNNFMGSFKIAHGGSMDSLSDSIQTALQYLTRVRKDMDEFNARWQQMEEILSLSIRDASPQISRTASSNNTLGLAVLATDTSNHSVGRPSSTLSVNGLLSKSGSIGNMGALVAAAAASASAAPAAASP